MSFLSSNLREDGTAEIKKEHGGCRVRVLGLLGFRVPLLNSLEFPLN